MQAVVLTSDGGLRTASGGAVSIAATDATPFFKYSGVGPALGTGTVSLIEYTSNGVGFIVNVPSSPPTVSTGTNVCLFLCNQPASRSITACISPRNATAAAWLATGTAWVSTTNGVAILQTNATLPASAVMHFSIVIST